MKYQYGDRQGAKEEEGQKEAFGRYKYAQRTPEKVSVDTQFVSFSLSYP